jgi:dihydrofolate reductase/diadenosine tetraphosphate (Ap4A) HIT family hydrolase
MAVSVVVATSRNRCIGRDGDLPWRLPSDLRRFKEITAGGTVLMGRRTYDSLPAKFRPLPGRRNLVLSRDPAYRPAGAEVFADLQSALAACDHDCFVIGGAAVYEQALPLAARLYVTLIDQEVAGDTFFPEIAEGEWVSVEEEGPLVENGHSFSFRTLIRSDRALYDLDAARSPQQRDRMARLERAGVCIFCSPDTAEHGEQPVEWRGEHWFVTRNRYPYAGTTGHYLIVANRHVTAFDELPDEAGAELWQIKRRLKDRLAPAATATVERSGDMRLNGGSIAHLHTHFVALSARPEETVRFRVSARAAGEP